MPIFDFQHRAPCLNTPLFRPCLHLQVEYLVNMCLTEIKNLYTEIYYITNTPSVYGMFNNGCRLNIKNRYPLGRYTPPPPPRPTKYKGDDK